MLPFFFFFFFSPLYIQEQAHAPPPFFSYTGSRFPLASFFSTGYSSTCTLFLPTGMMRVMIPSLFGPHQKHIKISVPVYCPLTGTSRFLFFIGCAQALRGSRDGYVTIVCLVHVHRDTFPMSIKTSRLSPRGACFVPPMHRT